MCTEESCGLFLDVLLHSRRLCDLYWCCSMPVNMKAALTATSNLKGTLAVLRIQATATFPTTGILYNS